MEFLCQNGLAPPNIANYLAAVRANFVMCGLSTTFMNDDRIHLFLRATKINRPLSLKIQSIVTEPMLYSVLQACSHFQHPQVFSALYSFLFFSFLRLSNILPHSNHTFDPSRQLCRGDIIFSTLGATVLLKWSKTNQERQQIQTIAIQKLGHSVICPIRALHSMIALLPGQPNDPLFMIQSANQTIPLTDSRACKHLKDISIMFHIYPTLTFHMFRKGGTTWAFQHSVPIQHIILHGSWSSNAVWRYINSQATSSSVVSQTFSSYLHS